MDEVFLQSLLASLRNLMIVVRISILKNSIFMGSLNLGLINTLIEYNYYLITRVFLNKKK